MPENLADLGSYRQAGAKWITGSKQWPAGCLSSALRARMDRLGFPPEPGRRR